MQLLILFGLPGAGKTYVGKLLQANFNYYFYDGDTDLTEEMKRAVIEKTTFTEDMRDIFFAKLIKSMKKQKDKHTHLVVAQMFIKEKYRKLVQQNFPEARFLLIEAATDIREKRLTERTDYPLDIAYVRKMCLLFEKPEIGHDVIRNNADGKEKLKEQLTMLLEQLD